MTTPTAIVAYLALFGSVGFLFLFANLLLGKFLRPHDPHPEKLEIYECGEPTIGSSFVQFDLRFYVVALVFIVFDVEVAFLFPLSTVFGKATHLADPHYEAVVATSGVEPGIKPETVALYQELGVENPQFMTEGGAAAINAAVHATGQTLAWTTFLAINVFFIVLLIGFAYEWKTGAFDWVRALRGGGTAVQLTRQPPPPIHEEQPALSI